MGMLLLFFGAASALAVLPDEVMDDPVLEARARALSSQLRCMVCQNQSIDDSDAELARDLRLLVRERLAAGDTDSEVIAFVVSRYGEFVLLKPHFNFRNSILWLAPLLLLFAGGTVLILFARNKSRTRTSSLSDAEKRAIAKILSRGDRDA